MMMTKEEFEALCRVVAWLQDEENQAIYQGSFRRENNDTLVLDNYLRGLLSTGIAPTWKPIRQPKNAPIQGVATS